MDSNNFKEKHNEKNNNFLRQLQQQYFKSVLN